MGSIAEIGGSIISRAQVEAATVSQNMANSLTPGYRAQRSFAREMVPEQLDMTEPAPALAGTTGTDFAQGKMIGTTNPFDLAIQGEGFFTLRAGDKTYYSRSGQFSRSADGLLVSPEGWTLQGSSGDIVASGTKFEVTSDGVVIQDGVPTARLAIKRFADPSQLTPVGAASFDAVNVAGEDLANPMVRQGMLESSNISSGTEMVELMAAMRRAESGQRIVQLYDDLMSKAITGLDFTK